MDVNVGRYERWGSLLAGGGLLALTARRGRSPLSALLALAGLGLLVRGATGHCATYAALGADTADRDKEGGTAPAAPQGGTTPRLVPQPWRDEKDLVDEASEESFPASDPPSFNPTKVG